MEEKRLERARASVNWGPSVSSLPVVTLVDVAARVKSGQKLIVVDGVVHDVAKFMPEHPGGVKILESHIGTDASQMFHGIAHEHSIAAVNLLADLRIARVGFAGKNTVGG